MSAASRFRSRLGLLLLFPLLGGCAAGGGADGGAPEVSGAAGAPPAAQTALASTPAPGDVVRRVIYTAEVTLGVPELGAWEKDLRALVRTYGGYLSGNELAGEPGAPRTGTWKVRVPADRYGDFLAAVQDSGEVERVRTDSQDVSEEFVDVSARVKNRRVEEARLLEHLRRSTSQLQDILTVERELSRVREEIERLEGRLRYLRDRTDYSLVTLVVSEKKAFAPPRQPGLGTEIARVWSLSVGTVGAVARALLLTLVALSPWLLVCALVGLPAWRHFRRSVR